MGVQLKVPFYAGRKENNMKFFVMSLIGDNEVQDVTAFTSFTEALNYVEEKLGYSGPGEGCGYKEDAEGNERWWAFGKAHFDNTNFYSYVEWTETPTTVRQLSANWQYAIADELTFKRLWVDRIIDEQLEELYRNPIVYR